MTRQFRSISLLLFTLCFTPIAEAQVEDVIEEDDDDDEELFDPSTLIAAGRVKAFCSNRILGQAPTKLITLGYDYQSGHTLSSPLFDGSEFESGINSAQTLRFAINYPVLSRNSVLLNLAAEYQNTAYNFANEPIEYSFHNALAQNNLQRIGFFPTLFKPLNPRNFIIAQASVYLFTNSIEDAISENKFRYQGALIYGWKSSDYRMWGIGATRTYLGGALNYLPIVYYRYSSRDESWGIEAILPSRVSYRRTLNKKSILNGGFYVEGGSFYMAGNTFVGSRMGALTVPPGDYELRRAELRFFGSYDFALSKLFWLGAEIGYRYNWSYNLDDGDFFRGFFTDRDYLIENTLTNPVYFQVSISFVSP